MLLFVTVLTICIISRSEADFFIPCIPVLQKHFGLSPFEVQLSLSLNFIGYCLGGLIAGFLGDKFNYRMIIISSLAIFPAATLLCALAGNYGLVLFGRFVHVMALVAWSLSYKVVEASNKVTDKITVFLPFKEYFTLIKSRKLMIFTGALCFIIAPYWVFISMSPIYYVNDLGVPLIEYMWYKNILAIIFGIISLMNGLIVDKFGCKNCFLFSIVMCFISIICQFIIVLTGIDEPKIITAAMAILTVGTAFLINFLYANALTAITNHMGKASVVIHSVRLIFTSVSLSIVSKLYYGNFFVIGIALIIMMLTGLLITLYLYSLGYLKGIAR